MGEMETGKPSILVIVGMHRSGTSLTASLLQNAGLHIGDRLMSASSSNTKGHFENLDFFEFHRAILQAHAIHADGWTLQKQIDIEPIYLEGIQALIDRNTRHPVWGWKDPRTTLFLDFWSQRLPTANYLIVYRTPWDVIDSLYRRNTDDIFQKQPDLAPKIWHHYNQTLLDFHNTHPGQCFLVNLQTFLNHTQDAIAAINQQFQLELKTPDPSLYESTLLHNAPSNSTYPGLLNHYFPATIALYGQLEGKAWRPDDTSPEMTWRNQTTLLGDRACAFRHWSDLRTQEKRNNALEAELNQTKQQRDDLHSQLNNLQQELKKLQEAQLPLLETELNQTKQQRDDLHSQLQSLQQEFQQLQEARSPA